MKCNLPEEEKTLISGNIEMNLYDLNKQIISQLPSMPQEEFEDKAQLFVDFANKQQGSYYMLLCNDLKYYTLFAINPSLSNPFLEDEVLWCIGDFADTVRSIELTESGDAIEIWFTKDEETYVMYFFDYTGGVIECAR